MQLPGARPSVARYDFRADPVLRAVLDYWEQRRQGGAMPSRRDIDPEALRQVLPHLQITEVVDGGARFRYRLVGTAIVEAFGAEFTGKYVDELVSGERDSFVHGCYRAVCAARRPAFVRSRYITTKAIDLTANRVLAPLSEDGVGVSQILGALTFEFTRPFTTGIGHNARIDLSSSYVDILGEAPPGDGTAPA
ncbi:MAG TPA: PAS domain-containing protein [Stellaceae bacterium]|nr:PAS domain-containing protein [Stellaceae bacterium]